MKNKFFPITICIILFNLSCRGPEGPTGPAGSSSQSLTDPSIQPQIIATHPTANSVGPYEDFANKEIQIRFNKIMDRTSIKRAVSLYSNMQNLRIDTSNIHSIGGDVFTFHPIDSYGRRTFLWGIKEVDTFKISTSVKDVNGNYLSSPFVMTFKPEPALRVVSVFPVEGATGVPSDTSVLLQFNSSIDRSIVSSLEIQPSLGGRWEIIDATSIRFRPDTSFKTNTTYTIKVYKYANDVYGNLLPKEFVSSFTTGYFTVILTSPSDGSENVSLYRSISVMFNSPLDISSVPGAFKITPQLAGQLNLYERHTVFTFVPEPELAAESIYTVTIDTTLRSIRGDKLSAPHQFSFATGRLEVIFTSPFNGSVNISRFLNRIEMYFNARLDTSTVRAAFNNGSITGSLQIDPNGEYFYYYVTGAPLHDNTMYTLGVSTALRTRGGVYLKLPYFFSFTTGI